MLLRELNLSAESALSAYTLKAYLRAAETYLPHWDKEMAQKLLDLFGLDKKKKLGKLSKGMLSMVTILVAMASKAEFTFLDEPVAGLDVVAREQFYQLLLEEYTETGRTFVLSTHIIEEAADVMEEVIILDKGKILMKENTQELVDRARYVTGLTDQVDGATAGLPCHHIEKIGRSKTVTVLLPEGEDLNSRLRRDGPAGKPPKALCSPLRRGGASMRLKLWTYTYIYYRPDHRRGRLLYPDDYPPAEPELGRHSGGVPPVSVPDGRPDGRGMRHDRPPGPAPRGHFSGTDPTGRAGWAFTCCG